MATNETQTALDLPTREETAEAAIDDLFARFLPDENRRLGNMVMTAAWKAGRIAEYIVYLEDNAEGSAR